MSTIWAYAKQGRTWKIAGVALAALIMLLSLVGILSPALGILTFIVSFVFGFRAGCKQLRKLFKRRQSFRSMVDYKEDPRVIEKLLPGERVIIATPEHPVAIPMSVFSFGTVIALAIGAAVGMIASAHAQASTGGHGVHLSLATVLTAMTLAFIVRIIYRILVWRTDLLVLTNKHVYTVAGYLSRERDEIRLKSIAGITSRTSMISYVFSWLGIIDEPIGYVKATGIGTIFERFKHVPNIDEFTRQLKIAWDQA